MTRDQFTELLLEFTATRHVTLVWALAVVDWVRAERALVK